MIWLESGEQTSRIGQESIFVREIWWENGESSAAPQILFQKEQGIDSSRLKD